MTKAGYYSLIQYCPDLFRQEAANVGTILIVPQDDYVEALTDKTLLRARRFFQLDIARVDHLMSMLSGFEERLRMTQIASLFEFEQFIASWSNHLQLTAPRPIRVREPQKTLSTLFDDLFLRT